MPTITKTIEPVRNAAGKLVGYYTHEDTLTPVRLVKGKPTTPPPPRKALRTTQQTTPPRTKAMPQRQPKTSAPVAFYAPRLGRVITNTHCLKCQHTHQACQCWPPCSYSQAQLTAAAAEANAPLVRENTFSAVVALQKERGLRAGAPTTPAPRKTETTLEAVVRLRKERGLM